MALETRSVPFSRERFGRYELLERLGQGGMAEVFLARLSHNGKPVPVAIKRMLDVLVDDADFVNMFRDEARIVGSLEHENIASLYEIGRAQNTYFIAMEHVWGRDLLQLVNRYRKRDQWVPPDVIAWVARQVCHALQYAHERRDGQGNPLSIIHRDVSPQNILLAYRGDVKLIDFGVALATARRTHTTAGTIKGKFGYMSPEQARGDTLDPRCDVFALGICMHEAIAGRRLFLGRDDVETLKNVQRAPIPSLSDLVPGTPLELETIVYKSLSRNRGTRYQSAAELGEALDRFLVAYDGLRSGPELGSIVQTMFGLEWREERDRLGSWFSETRVEEEVSDPTILLTADDIEDESAEVYFSAGALPLIEESPTVYGLESSDTVNTVSTASAAQTSIRPDRQRTSAPVREQAPRRRGPVLIALLAGLLLGVLGTIGYFLTQPSEIVIHGLSKDHFVRVDDALIPSDTPRATNLTAGTHEVLIGRVGGDSSHEIRLRVSTRRGETAHVWLNERVVEVPVPVEPVARPREPRRRRRSRR